jgi:hypothetical protein
MHRLRALCNAKNVKVILTPNRLPGVAVAHFSTGQPRNGKGEQVKAFEQKAMAIGRQADANIGKSSHKPHPKTHHKPYFHRGKPKPKAKKESPLFTGEFIGDLIDNKRHGHGTYKNRISTYTGEWRDNKRCGFGEATFESGNSYLGEWQDNMPHGAGKLKYIDETELEGVFEKGELVSGTGKYIPGYMGEATNIYDGTFVDGKLQGHGVWVNSDDTSYVGEWKDSKHHGRGVRRTQTFTYDGDWVYNSKEGQGRLTTNTGHTYEGHFEKNEFHGPGKITYADGATLEGTFRSGKVHEGQGRWVSDLMAPTFRTVLEGTWAEGKLHGAGKVVSVDGFSYVGDFKEGKRHGHGVLTYPGGRCFRGEFVEGEPYHGEGWYKSTEMVEGQKTTRFLHGRWVEGVFTALPEPESQASPVSA